MTRTGVRRLDGVRVAVTRPEGRAAELVELLEAEGATAIACPTIRVEPADPLDEVDRALGRLDDYTWVVFTSASAVDVLLARPGRGSEAARALSRSRIACVGSATARALESHGLVVAYAPDDFTGRRLGETLEPVAGLRVLFPRGDLGGATLAQALVERGATVDDPVVYRTVAGPPPPDCLQELERGVDALTFTSPSTVRGFVELGAQWRRLVGEAIVVSIGPVTSAALEEVGLGRWVEAREHTSEGIVEALAEALAQGMANEPRGHHA